MIKLYTVENCFHCADVKRKLKELNIDYEEVVCGVEELNFLIPIIATEASSLTMRVIMKDNKVIQLEDL